MQTLLLRLATQLPSPARDLVTVGRIRVILQLAMFATVGFAGLTIDTITVYALRHQLGLYAAGVLSYCLAATATWLLNRNWTFRGHGSGPAHRQWVKFLIANLAGFMLNRGTYAALITFVPLCAQEPVYATAAGAVVGMFLNFNMSRMIVFR